MMLWYLFNAVLFYAFVPGVLVTLPPGSSHQVVLLVHSVLFAVVHHFLGQQLKKQVGY
jgi:hypothetical protein